MAELDVGKATITDMTTRVDDYEVDTATPDEAGDQKETRYSYPDSPTYLGYYKNIPELKKAVDALAQWTAGKGFTADSRTTVILERITGWGKDTIKSIIISLIAMKKVLGDSFAEIIRNENGDLINLKQLYTGAMTVVIDEFGIIKRYEQRSRYRGVKPRLFKPNEMLHLVNDRVANEIHGTSVIEACKWVIDARNECLEDHRKVIHRNRVPVRIIEIDTEDTAKRNALIKEYEDAINKGEVLVLPKGTVEVKDTKINIQDPILWIKYLENFFYQAVGVPKVIMGGSEEYTEAASKVGYMTFEQPYTTEQHSFEADFFAQTGLRITLNKGISLKDTMQESEEKNTGQLGFQPKETKATMERE